MQYMIIDADTDEMIDIIDICSDEEKNTYEDNHPEHYLLEDEVYDDLDEDYDLDFEDEDD